MTTMMISFLSYLIIIIIIIISGLIGNVISLEQTTTPPLLNSPTYSLATLNLDGSTNLNILTYATPLSVTPQRVWSMGLFKGTLSEENFQRTGVAVLQVLRESHAKLVPLLGGTSGRIQDKQTECAQLGFAWIRLEDGNEDDDDDAPPPMMVLPGCEAYLKLCQMGEIIDLGSHVAAICRVDAMYKGDEQYEGKSIPLMTAKLREMGIITKQGRVSE